MELRVSVPALPVTVTAYVPGVVELTGHDTVLVELAVRVTDPGHVIVSPCGLALAARVAVPLKLNVLVMVTLTDTPVWPTIMSLPVTKTLKSPTWTDVVAECTAVPGEPVPVMVTVKMPLALAATPHDAV